MVCYIIIICPCLFLCIYKAIKTIQGVAQYAMDDILEKMEGVGGRRAGATLQLVIKNHNSM